MGSVSDDAIDDKEYEGNIFSLLENTKQFIKNNYKVRWKKTPDGRIDMPDYDEDAIHEAIVNALVHRLYIVPGTEVHVNMFDDRLEIQSPGGMVSGKRIQDLDLWSIPSERRNPILADLFQRMKLMERRGSGIKKILEIYEGKKQPVFISTETDFTAIFYNENYKKSEIKKAEVKSGSKKAEVKSGSKRVSRKTEEHYKKILNYLDVVDYAKSSDIAEILNVKSTRVNELLRELERNGKVLSKGKYKDRIYMGIGSNGPNE